MDPEFGDVDEEKAEGYRRMRRGFRLLFMWEVFALAGPALLVLAGVGLAIWLAVR